MSTASRRPSLRWAIVAMLFASTVLNYLDRQTLSILATTVQADLGMSDLAYAHVVQLFLLAYAFAYLLAGRVTDWLGTRLSLALFVGWWSIANMLTGLAQNVSQLGAARFALGLGEAGNYTAGPKAVSEHFEPAERGLALGIYTAGAMVGATIAPPLIGWLALTHGWRAAFIVTGALGLFWILAWFAIYPRSTDSREALPVAPLGERALWRSILSERAVWGLAMARLIADPVWYFYLFWFPKYLQESRDLSLALVASVAWLVYLAADFGSVGGGLLSGRLIRRGMSPARARLVAMGLAACLAPVGFLIAGEPSIPVTLALAATVAFAHLIFQINISTLVVDLYPGHVVATVFGVIGAGSALGGILSTQVVGLLVTQQSYGMVFILMAFCHPIAFAIAWWATRSPKTSILRHAEGAV